MKPPLNWYRLGEFSVQSSSGFDATVTIVSMWKYADADFLRSLVEMQGGHYMPFFCPTKKQGLEALREASIPRHLFQRLGSVFGDLTGLGFPCLQFRWGSFEVRRSWPSETHRFTKRREIIDACLGEDVLFRGKRYQMVHGVGSDRTSSPRGLTHFVPSGIVRP